MNLFRQAAAVFLVLSFSAFVATGCRTNRERYLVDAFSAEARLLEDRIYELHDKVETLERRIDQQRDDGPRGSRSSSDVPRGSSPGPRRDPAPPPPPRRNGFDLDDPDLTPPVIDPGTSARPPDLEAHPVRHGVKAPPPVTTNRPRRPLRQVAQGASERQISGLAFDAFLLGSAPSDGSRVTGLELLIFPVNDQDQLVPIPGEITVVVLNSADQSHIGRWEYDTATARAALKSEGTESGILLELKWQPVLREPDLHVFVRLELPDGRRFAADRPFTASGNAASKNVEPESGGQGSERSQLQTPAADPGVEGDEKLAVTEETRLEQTGDSGEQDTPRELESPAEAAATRRAARQQDQGPSASVYR